jgi:hypothetical protein
MPSGSVVGRSFMQCTAKSISPLSSATSNSLVKTPFEEKLESGFTRSLSPSVVMPTTARAAPTTLQQKDCVRSARRGGEGKGKKEPTFEIDVRVLLRQAIADKLGLPHCQLPRARWSMHAQVRGRGQAQMRGMQTLLSRVPMRTTRFLAAFSAFCSAALTSEKPPQAQASNITDGVPEIACRSGRRGSPVRRRAALNQAATSVPKALILT